MMEELGPREALVRAETHPQEAALAFLRFCRETHVVWAQFLREHPDYPTADVGDAAYHDADVQMYDVVIEQLKRSG